MEIKEFFGNISNVFKRINPTEFDEFGQYTEKTKRFDEAIARGPYSEPKQTLTRIAQGNFENPPPANSNPEIKQYPK